MYLVEVGAASGAPADVRVRFGVALGREEGVSQLEPHPEVVRLALVRALSALERLVGPAQREVDYAQLPPASRHDARTVGLGRWLGFRVLKQGDEVVARAIRVVAAEHQIGRGGVWFEAVNQVGCFVDLRQHTD